VPVIKKIRVFAYVVIQKGRYVNIVKNAQQSGVLKRQIPLVIRSGIKIIRPFSSGVEQLLCKV
jgi:hypothetical protein